MAEMEFDYTPVPLQTIFESAKGFGLTDEEVWRTINDSICEAGFDLTVPEYIDELTAALAERIVTKERSARS